MANKTKTYVIIKDGVELETLKTLAAAKKLADTEGAEVFCGDECVYKAEPVVQEVVEQAEPAAEPVIQEVTEQAETVEAPAAEQPTPKNQYRLKALMNVRSAPSMSADKVSTLPAGTIISVRKLQGDWLHLSDGTFILYGDGKYAEKVSESCPRN